MGFDFFTVNTLAAELECALAGRSLGAAYGGSKGLELHPEGMSPLVIQVGSRGLVFLRTGAAQGIADSRDDPALRYLQQARIVSVAADPRDRIVWLRLERISSSGRATYGLLAAELMQPNVVAVLLRARNNEVLGCWGRRGSSSPALRPGVQYQPPAGVPRLLPGIDSAAAFRDRLAGIGGELERAGAMALAMMDRPCMREILHRANLPADVDVTKAGDEVHAALWEISSALYRSPVASGCYAWEEGEEWRFSVLRPTRLGREVTCFATVSGAIEHCVTEECATVGLRRRRRRVLQGLRSAENRLQRRERAIADDLAEAEQAEEVERQANTLMARLHEVPPHSSEVVLRDVHDIKGTRAVRIQLEPGRKPVETASALLKRARRLRRRRAVLPSRLEDCREELRSVRSLCRSITADELNGLEEAEAWLQDGKTMRGGQESGRGAQRGAEAHPRRYRTSTGWSVWVGRSNRENDVLTHKLAAQSDIWMHVHGYAGAHVVLRREGRKQEPDRSTLQEAAGVAAYWSKGRSAKRVAVVYTLVKHVSRPRGGVPGQAVLRHEKTVMASPALLQQENEVV